MDRMILNDYFLHLCGTSKEIELRFNIKTVSKERPRKSGHMYTPAKTRKFEAKVREMASTITAPPFACPVKITIRITEPVPKSYSALKRKAATLGLITPPRGDLDNKTKAVTDALNRVAYLDDVQITEQESSKCYADEHTLYVRVQRAGLSSQELEDYRTRYDGHSSRGAKLG